MALFNVTEVVDGDTFVVSPGWQVNTKKGDRVRIADFNAPELRQHGGDVAHKKLQNLILRQDVELYTRAIDTYGRLVAVVHLNGQNITQYLNVQNIAQHQ